MLGEFPVANITGRLQSALSQIIIIVMLSYLMSTISVRNWETIVKRVNSVRSIPKPHNEKALCLIM